MASRIKGIIVEIGGDTTGLEKTLKSVKTSIKSSETALKDVNHLIKFEAVGNKINSVVKLRAL